MLRRTRALTQVAVSGIAALALALAAVACGASDVGSENGGSGGVDTPRRTFAMVTHAARGDTFWDILRKGAETAATKDNVELVYSNDENPAGQANLVQNAIDDGVDGIAVTLAHPEALAAAVAKAKAAGIPVVGFNSGLDAWKDVGVMEYFGQDENLAGLTVGGRLSDEGASKALCVIMEEGQVALEARCAGTRDGFFGQTEILRVPGTDRPAVRTAIADALRQDPSIDRVVTLGAPFALVANQAIADAGSSAEVVTFDLNLQVVEAIKAGTVLWAVDQQPYLQGYLAVDSLWLFLTNGNIIGGGETARTGPMLVTPENVDEFSTFAQGGTR